MFAISCHRDRWQLRGLSFANCVVTYQRTRQCWFCYYSLYYWCCSSQIMKHIHRFASLLCLLASCYCLQDQKEQNDFTALASLVFPAETPASQAWRYMTSYRHTASPFYFWSNDCSTNFGNFNSAIESHFKQEISVLLVTNRTIWSIHDCFCSLSANGFVGWSASDSSHRDERASAAPPVARGCTGLCSASGQCVCLVEACWFGILLRYNCPESKGLFYFHRCCWRRCCWRRQRRRLCFG